MDRIKVKAKCPHCGKEHEQEWTLQMLFSVLESQGVDLEQLLRDGQRILPAWKVMRKLGF